MNELLNRISVENVKFDGQILLSLVLLWSVVVACSISSVFSQPFNRTGRIFWIGCIVLLPVVGLMAYLPFSFKRDELPQIFQARSKGSKEQRRNKQKGRSA